MEIAPLHVCGLLPQDNVSACTLKQLEEHNKNIVPTTSVTSSHSDATL